MINDEKKFTWMKEQIIVEREITEQKKTEIKNKQNRSIKIRKLVSKSFYKKSSKFLESPKIEPIEDVNILY